MPDGSIPLIGRAKSANRKPRKSPSKALSLAATYTPFHARFFAYRLTLAGHGDEALTRSLASSRIDLKPHQVEAARFALASPLSKGVILADEVGLGKTIEAGLIIAQKWAERRRRILLVVPASLRAQWQQELREKFDLPSRILDQQTYRRAARKAGVSALDQATEIVIASYETVTGSAMSGDVGLVAWDLVVVDEAHRLRNVLARANSRARRLKDTLDGRFKVLLTATPIQNRMHDLIGLLSVIDGDLAKGLDGKVKPDAETRDLIGRRLLPILTRHLRRDVQEAGHVRYTERLATTIDFQASEPERQLYERLSSYLQDPASVAFGDRTKHLVLLGARKTMGSSTAAIIEFLKAVRDRLQKSLRIDADALADIDALVGAGADSREADLLDEREHSDSPNEWEEPSADRIRPLQIDERRLAVEVGEVEVLLALAKSIEASTKTGALIRSLPTILDEIEARGGRRKAVIFTESVRTQHHLFETLSASGYRGQIVLLNGSNSDADSRALLDAWRRRKGRTENASGSRGSDMKAAIVDAFRSDRKTILIATESGAEGVNLQFCSVLINYDLPWNPMKVEQRIGRCHRYGQLIDVTVVNMIDSSNAAEARIYELLQDKFELFKGVFGTSDDVLGQFEAGASFEKKVLEIVQTCRSADEINIAFDALEAELSVSIQSDRNAAVATLIRHFDQAIVDRLKAVDREFAGNVERQKRRLWLFARSALPKTTFNSTGQMTFQYRRRTYGLDWHEADGRNGHFFRIGDGNLVDGLIGKARADTGLPVSHLTFDYRAYRKEKNARLSDVERLRGKSGWISVSLLTSDAETGTEEQLIIAAVTDNEVEIDPETAERFFQMPATVSRSKGRSTEALLVASQKKAALAAAGLDEQRTKWLHDERLRLRILADDTAAIRERQIQKLKDQAKDLRAQLTSRNMLPTQCQALRQQLSTTEGKWKELAFTRLSAHQARIEEHAEKLAEAAQKLAAMQSLENVLEFRWTIR